MSYKERCLYTDTPPCTIRTVYTRRSLQGGILGAEIAPSAAKQVAYPAALKCDEDMGIGWHGVARAVAGSMPVRCAMADVYVD